MVCLCVLSIKRDTCVNEGLCLTYGSEVTSYGLWEKPCQGIVSEVKSLSRVRLFATPWTVAHQDPQS